MSDVDELKANVELYKKLRTEADEKVKAAIEKAVRNRAEQKARQTRPA